MRIAQAMIKSELSIENYPKKEITITPRLLLGELREGDR